MLKVAFWFDAPLGYTGGLNYIKNLLHALSLVNDGTVQPYVFFASDVPAQVVEEFAPYAKVVRTRILKRWTVPWFVHKVLYKALDSSVVVNALMRAHGIDVVSHAWIVYKGATPFRIISWIPDFQYLHLPELFPGLDPEQETQTNQKIIAQSDMVILSSRDAYSDFLRIAPPADQSKGAVLPFVCQPGRASAGSAATLAQMEAKYGFEGPFFLLPNQFWAHKNHLVVLEAVRHLKRAGTPVQVLCTGNTKDFRLSGTPYVDSLRAFIRDNGLEQEVKILGLIDYGDLLFLMRHCVAVINPSRFEGWSSSVEEAKSIGKPVVLSRIGVHVEQAPMNGHYFDPADAGALAAILSRLWAEQDPQPSPAAEEMAWRALHERTLAFGQAYLRLLQQVPARMRPSSAPARG